MKIGYARGSTQDQSLDKQIDRLKAEGCEKIFHDKESKRVAERPAFTKCLEYLHAGDMLVVTKLDRLDRRITQLMGLVDELRDSYVEFKSLDDNIDTTSSQGSFLYPIMADFSEMEAELVRERTLAGLEAARVRGREGGRPTLSQNKANHALALYDSKQYSVREITEMVGFSKTKLYQMIRERNKEQ